LKLQLRIDLNCDMGEGAGDDEALLAVVTSANIACGVHAGDAQTMTRTIKSALAHGVAVGAHPSYPDREGFGRRSMALAPAQAERIVADQIETLAAIAQANHAKLVHVKPHGALYNDAARDRDLADAIAGGVKRVDPDLVLVGLAGSKLIDAARDAGLRSAAEGFCDRAYEPDGSLMSRSKPGAVYIDPEQAARQAVGLAKSGKVQTLCIHGDTPGAAAIARAVRAALEAAGIAVEAAR
jgi:UPF0271 protein